MNATAAILAICIILVAPLFKKNRFYHLFWGFVFGTALVGMMNLWLIGRINLLQETAIYMLVVAALVFLIKKYLTDDDHEVL